MADLFGAATRGVDPQTGKYLSKEQRIAMFRASRGMGGGIGGGGTGARAAANPQTAIVAVNKMAGAIQQIQRNNQQTTQNVAAQVQQNKNNIQNLYNTVAEQREQRLENIQAEVEQSRLARENSLRRAREGVLEGISSAAAAVAATGRAAANAALRPVRGLWERIRGALGYLLAAFAIKNLPQIVNTISNFLDGLPDLSSAFTGSLGKIRGLWSIIDIALRGVRRLIGRIINTAFRIGRFIFNKAFQIGRRIFAPIGRFIRRVVSAILRRVGNFVKDLAKKAIQKIVPPAGNLFKRGANLLRRGVQALPGGERIIGAVDTGRNFLGKIGNIAQSAYQGVQGVAGNLRNLLTSSGQTAPVQSEVAKQGWLKRALNPITDVLKRAGGGTGKFISGLLGNATKLISKIPVIGSVIDILLNKNIEGQSWTEAIIRGLASGSFGALGWKAGALAGGALGSVVPGFGTAIGAVLGGIAGSILAGRFGDQGGAALYELLTGKTRTEGNENAVLTGEDLSKAGEDLTENIKGVASAGVEAIKNGAAEFPRNPNDFEFNIKGAKDAIMGAGRGVFDVVGDIIPSSMRGDGGGNVTVLNNETAEAIPIESKETKTPKKIQDIPRIKPADASSDVYRQLAAKYYQLAF